MKRQIQNMGIVGGCLACLILAPNAFAADTPAASTETAVAVPASAAAPVAVTAAAATDVNADTISLDFKDADIGSVLRVLSMKSNINIVTGPEVRSLDT